MFLFKTFNILFSFGSLLSDFRKHLILWMLVRIYIKSTINRLKSEKRLIAIIALIWHYSQRLFCFVENRATSFIIYHYNFFDSHIATDSVFGEKSFFISASKATRTAIFISPGESGAFRLLKTQSSTLFTSRSNVPEIISIEIAIVSPLYSTVFSRKPLWRVLSLNTQKC